MPFGSANMLWSRLRVPLIQFLLLLPMISAAMAESTSSQSIPILDNRFRVDGQVESIVLFVQRQEQSQAVVVVQPDGSKWYANRHPNTVQWSTTNNSDMIRINNPTPGPWQLFGSIEKESQVRVLSDIVLQHSEMPNLIYRGERLKMEAEVHGDGERLILKNFSRQLDWLVSLVSRNREGDENFAMGPYTLGHYSDSGTGFDEHSDDGKFAGELNFNYPAGLYDLSVRVANPSFSRQANYQIEILPAPVALSVETIDQQVSVLSVVSAPELVLAELHIELTVVLPDQSETKMMIEPFAYEQKIYLNQFMEIGSYAIHAQVMGSTNTGKEFVLSLAPVHFHRLAPPVVARQLTPIEVTWQKQDEAAQNERDAKQNVLKILIVTLLIVLAITVLIIVLWFLRDELKGLFKKKADTTEEVELTPETVDLNALNSPDKPAQ